MKPKFLKRFSARKLEEQNQKLNEIGNSRKQKLTSSSFGKAEADSYLCLPRA
jgi:hypothetical protein